MLSAKHRFRIRRIIPFVIIWFVLALVYCVVDMGIRADSPSGPAVTTPYDPATAFLTVCPASIIMGLAMGLLEVYVLNHKFRNRSFAAHITIKTAIYTAAVIVFITGVRVIYNSLYRHLSIADPEIVRIPLNSLGSVYFWSIVTYAGTIVAVSLLFAEIRHHMGHGVLRNYFTGRYRKPKEEERIFMFLDMKSSTTIAEQMGHVDYFGLLNRYYADMTEAILASSGEICQYVGDEIVISWTLSAGVWDNNCLVCFFRIKDRLEGQAAHYLKAFGRVPGFKAGLHCGHVTTGEIGSVRKDIIFTGDVMNTTARIQCLCNEHEVDILVSEALMTKLKVDRYQVREIGMRELKGKDEKVRLYTVARGSEEESKR
jgi:adenylate cyclase